MGHLEACPSVSVPVTWSVTWPEDTVFPSNDELHISWYKHLSPERHLPQLSRMRHHPGCCDLHHPQFHSPDLPSQQVPWALYQYTLHSGGFTPSCLFSLSIWFLSLSVAPPVFPILSSVTGTFPISIIPVNVYRLSFLGLFKCVTSVLLSVLTTQLLSFVYLLQCIISVQGVWQLAHLSIRNTMAPPMLGSGPGKHKHVHIPANILIFALFRDSI